ncbi:HAMP domain-containing histidine kinase [Myxococcota bacterium]|nr:HAMP domain-containing histidine kinase [Myxococcota bacterium]
MESTRFGIRYRLSVLLLLAAFNSAAMLALCVVLFSAVADSPPDSVRSGILNVQGLVDLAHDTALTGDLRDPQTRQTLEKALSNAAGLVNGLEPPQASVASDLLQYREAAAALVATMAARPEATPDTDPQLAEDLEVLRRTHDHLRGSMQLAISYPRPAWVEQAIPMVPWAMAWVLAIGAVTVAGAWSLRSLVSRPLADLADAARALARGELQVEIPRVPAAPEIDLLAQAMRSARDGLSRALAERESRSAREKAILAHMSDGVLLLDADGTVLQLNPRAEQILWQLAPLGVEPRVGLPVWHLVREIGPKVLDAREPQDLEAVRVVPGRAGREARTWVALTVRPVPPLRPGAGGAFALMLRDITAQRELDQLQREFLSVITHELKTPLTAIEGYARLLQRGKAGPLQDRQREFVDTIAGQSAVLKTMVQNLLDTSRLEDGRLPIERQRVELARLVEDLAATWRGGAASQEIALRAEAQGAQGVYLEADPFRLQQVVGNLVGNALKFTPRGGHITLRARGTESHGILEVEDTGRGIPADKVDRIFEKFFQVERGDTRVAGGAGLGLYICKQLVEAMEGSISVRSTEGRGSCFTILLPRAQGQVLALPAERAPTETA